MSNEGESENNISIGVLSRDISISDEQRHWSVHVKETVNIALKNSRSLPTLLSRQLVSSRENLSQRYPQEYPAVRQIAVSITRAYLAGLLVSSVPQIVRVIISQLTSRPPKSLSARQLLARLFKILWRSTHSHVVLELLILFGSYQSILFLISLVWKKRLREDHKKNISRQLSFVKKVFRSEQTTPTSVTSNAENSATASETPTSESGSVSSQELPGSFKLNMQNCQEPLSRSTTIETLSDVVASKASDKMGQQRLAGLQADPNLAVIKEDDTIQCVIAAVISSTLCLPILTGAQRLDFGLFAIVRAVDSICSHHYDSIQHWFVGNVPKAQLLLDNMDTLAFVGSVTEILYSWFYVPNALPKSYSNWIARMSGTEACVYELPRFYRENANPAELSDAPLIQNLKNLCERRQVPPEFADPKNGFIPCQVMHEGINGCVNFWASKWMQSFSQSVKIYLPIHLLPILIFHRKLFMRTSQWPDIIARLLMSTTQSAAFLSTFIVLVFAPICIVRNIYKSDDSIWGPLLGSFASGWSLLIEKKKRRREFALYVIPRAIESLMYRTRMLVMGRGASQSSRALVQNGMFGYGGLESLMWIVGMSYFLVGSKVNPLALRGNARKIFAWFLAQDVPSSSQPGESTKKWTVTGFPSPDFSALRGFSPSRLATATFSSFPSLSNLATAASSKAEHIVINQEVTYASIFAADSHSDSESGSDRDPPSSDDTTNSSFTLKSPINVN